MSKHPGRRGKQKARRLKREIEEKVDKVCEKLDRPVEVSYRYSYTSIPANYTAANIPIGRIVRKDGSIS